ncbi:MAG: hypothetical protein COA71_06935 [SAR86 cluster bacterium]|uniref:TonB C-terminal domain-containing protein n=1 Tax=SAR86 cluster bacterium TaxID=2030880 RepID=A0A2A5CE01_9GAMM|nr:hypothetical protein [Gammaproteobacteria bacterium AH-315-E17]PCJ41741.1 MAG: hypothetical protein COA71_06935 [SAR86 cluster bacterium]
MRTIQLQAGSQPLRLLVCIIFSTLSPFISLPAHAQDDELTNLFFTPVPLSQADLITLNAGSLSDVDKQSAAEAIPRLQEELSEMETEDSSDPELLLQLNTLGLAQQAIERHEEAITSFDRAAALAVELYGESSLQQAPMLEQSIISHLKLNNISEITDIEELLYELRSEQYAADSAEMYTAMTNLADWYSAAYMKEGYLSRETGFIPRTNARLRGDQAIGLPPSVTFVGFIPPSINEVLDIRLRKLESLYEKYQESYTSNTTLTIVVDVARRIARLAYHAEQEMDYEREFNVFSRNYRGSPEEGVRNSTDRRDKNYDAGRIALEYVVDLVRQAEGVGAQQVALAFLDLADWKLAYGQIRIAREGYQSAYQVLRDEGFNDASIDAALTTAVPLPIPRIGAFPATQQTSGSLGLIPVPNYTGYIDVSFALNDIGNTTDITVLGSSQNDIGRIQKILENQIKLTKYRPLLMAGELVAQGRLEYRYYYSY